MKEVFLGLSRDFILMRREKMMGKIKVSAVVKCVVLFMAFALWQTDAWAQMQRVSIAGGGAQGDRGSSQASISDDGRYIAFRSNATNLVPDDTNNLSDVFVHNTQTGTTERVSFDTDGAQLDRGSFAPSLSDDGRYVVMQSYKSGFAQVMVYDRQSATTTQILPTSGSDPTDREARQEPVISGNGRFIAFHSYVNMPSALPETARPLNDDNNRAHDIYVYDLENQTTERVSRDSNGIEGNGDSFSASLSDDGNLVAFYSYASNLVVGDTNDAEDVFIKDRSTGITTRVSVATDGTEGNDDSYTPDISGNGRYVAFRSLASNLAPGDTNGKWDIFVHDLQTNTTELVSTATNGTRADGDSYAPSISDGGRYVVFRSNADNLVSGDTNNRWDIFLRDRQSGTTTRINVPTSGEADLHSYAPVISGDGTLVAFESEATNLSAGDTNESKDVFFTAREP